MNRNEIVEKLVATGAWGVVQAEMGIDANFECEYCGKNLLASVDNYKEWQTDHLIPQVANGSNERINLVVCCKTCNFIKGRWNPSLEYTDIHPTREMLLESATNYIFEKRKKTEEQIDSFKNIISRK